MRVLSIPAKKHENPYFDLFCNGLEEAGVRTLSIRQKAAMFFAFDVLHVHFPTHFVTENRPVAAFVWALTEIAFFLVCKLIGKPIVYTVHDVLPFTPRNGRILKPFLSIFYYLCDGYIFLSSSSREAFFSLFAGQQKKASILIPHGPYHCRIRTTTERSETRSNLALSDGDFVVGFIGAIKAYKNLNVLPELPRRLRNGEVVKVLVAGQVEQSYENQAADVLSKLPSDFLVRIDRRVSNDELDDLIQACDLVILPYTMGWNSGAAILVLSNRVRLLASDLPIFLELSRILPGWCRTFGNDDLRAHALDEALNAFAIRDHRNDDEAFLDEYFKKTSFLRGSQRLLKFYECLLQGTFPHSKDSALCREDPF